MPRRAWNSHASQNEQPLVAATSNDRERVYGALGTLYARCGGVFGVASFVDRCMDKWMACPVLNANERVTTWHAKAQRPGFKFLVVQIVCSLTGGPQQYTGRDMAHAHKHLNISLQEWEKFMELFNEVCTEFALPAGDTDDLNALMISMMDECVVFPGESAPRDPGPLRPGGHSVYAQLGGVYPIALFADRLVDALLLDPREEVMLGSVDGAKRNEASLKYLFTELICNMSGGPEVMTATSETFEETKLLLPPAGWDIFKATAEAAADHFLSVGARQALLQQVLPRIKGFVVDPSGLAVAAPAGGAGGSGRSSHAAAVKDLAAAAAGRMVSAAVIAARYAAPGAMVAARRRVLGDPRSIYGKGGGIFGLAKLSDALMDRWMRNPALNANAKVARWNETSQKFGFKFLVTQLMGYLTGGPQRYTGRPMDEAHKHLNIDAAQWSAFMQDADDVFKELRVPIPAQEELMRILSSYRGDCCVVRPGEVAPAEAPPVAARPQHDLFAKLGGVYPIAYFVDVVVELALERELFEVGSGRETGAEFVKNLPGLKYLLTELLCYSAGATEHVVTSLGYDEAKLGLSADSYSTIFLPLVEEAAGKVWPAHVASALLDGGLRALFGGIKAHLCTGMVAEIGDASGMDRLAREFGVQEARAALEDSGNDADRARDLLLSGWTPAAADRASTVANSVAPSIVGSPRGSGVAESRCPFGFGGARAASTTTTTAVADGAANAAGGQSRNPCKVLATIGSLDEKLGLVAGVLLNEQFGPASASGSQWQAPSVSTVAALLGRDEAWVRNAEAAYADAGGVVQVELASDSHSNAAGEANTSTLLEVAAGRLLGSQWQHRLDVLLDEDSDVCCPVSLMLFSQPVIASDGFMYEKDSLLGLLRAKMKSPMTREELKQDFIAAKQKRSEALTFREKRSWELLEFCKEARAKDASTTSRMVESALERVGEYVEGLGGSRKAPALCNKVREFYEVGLGKTAPAALLVG